MLESVRIFYKLETTMVYRLHFWLLFFVALLFCGCGGEKNVASNDYTVAFDVRKDAVYIDGVLYPDLYRELDGPLQHETNPLYDIGIKRIEEKTRRLKEEGKCEDPYNRHMTVGSRKINVERCSGAQEPVSRVPVRVDGDVPGRVLREISQIAPFFYDGQFFMVLDRDFHIPLKTSHRPDWASPFSSPHHKRVKCILKMLVKQDSLKRGKPLSQDEIKKMMVSDASLCKDEPEEPVNKSYMELSIDYSDSDGLYYAFYNRRPPLETDRREELLNSDKPEAIKPKDLQKRLQQEYERKSPEEREYPISITVNSNTRVLEPLKAAEAALQSGLKIIISFSY